MIDVYLAAKKSTSDKKSTKGAGGAQPVAVPVPPPAYQARPGTIPVITLGDLGKAVLTAGAGAVVTSIFITSLSGGSKFVGAFISAGLGILFTATSPVGTITSELGIGMLSSSAGWFVFETLGVMQSK